MMDWAEEKAAAWIDTTFDCYDECDCYECDWKYLERDLAVLLREVRAGYANAEMGAQELQAMERDRTLAEVRRVVTEVCGRWEYALDAGDEILSRLEKL